MFGLPQTQSHGYRLDLLSSHRTCDPCSCICSGAPSGRSDTSLEGYRPFAMRPLFVTFHSTDSTRLVSKTLQLMVPSQGGTYLHVLQPVLTLGAALLGRGLLTRVIDEAAEDIPDMLKVDGTPQTSYTWVESRECKWLDSSTWNWIRQPKKERPLEESPQKLTNHDCIHARNV
jgi:hypothetical protein